MKSTKITPRVFQLTHLMTIVGLALGTRRRRCQTPVPPSLPSELYIQRRNFPQGLPLYSLFLSAVINILLDLILLAQNT